MKGARAVEQSRSESPWLKSGIDSDNVRLELSCGRRNVWCSGEMLRVHTEHRVRRQLTKLNLPLRHESVGSKQD